MESSWQLKKFGECAELIRNTCLPGEFEAESYIGLEHIEEGKLRLLEIGNSIDVISTKSRFEPGDILFGKLRPYFRKVVRPSFSGVCSTDIWVVRAKHNTDQGYLFYWMASQEFINSATQASEGTKMPRAKWDFLERIEKTVPPLPEQRAIAHILGALDDKIELNRRMNQTLEAMAQALFKSWFVDFEPFRDQGMQDSPLGEIPVGWEVRKIGEVLELKYGKGLREDDRQPGDVPVYGSNGQVGWHNMSLVKGPGIVVGRKGNPGTVIWVPTDFFPIDTTFFVETKGPIRSMAYLFHALRSLDLPSLGADSAVPGLNRNMAYMSDILVPPAKILSGFDSYANAFMQKIYANEKESRTLAEIRDALLPKLLSGEIRGRDAERFVGEGTRVVEQRTQAIYTIGHSNHSLEEFIRLLKRHDITAVADVRSSPVSKRNPQFNRDVLSTALRKENISYVFMGRELGGRPDDPSCYDNGQADYLKMAEKPTFKEGINRLLRGKDRHRIVLLCAEKEPLDCHRTIFVSSNLYQMGIPIKHILANGEIEDHRDTEQRLVKSLGIGNELFDYSLTLTERIEKAYRQQARKIAYRLHNQEDNNEY